MRQSGGHHLGGVRTRIAIEKDGAMTTADEEARERIRLFFPPITIMLVCLPLLFGLIPRNRWYGVRVREAMTSDAAWYAVNRTGALALIGACLVWVAAATYAPRKYVKAIGVAAVLLTLLMLAATQRWTL
jgi:hypothetical protein